MYFRDKLVMFLATGGGAGNLPVAPGTFGSLLGLLLCFALSLLPPALSLPVLAAFIGLSIPIAHRAEKITGAKDPGRIVIDELAGMGVTMITLPFNTATAVGAFVVFRVLDIAKPPPIRWIERRLSGGVGVVMDDVVAGAIGHIILRFAMAQTVVSF